MPEDTFFIPVDTAFSIPWLSAGDTVKLNVPVMTSPFLREGQKVKFQVRLITGSFINHALVSFNAKAPYLFPAKVNVSSGFRSYLIPARLETLQILFTNLGSIELPASVMSIEVCGNAAELLDNSTSLPALEPGDSILTAPFVIRVYPDVRKGRLVWLKMNYTGQTGGNGIKGTVYASIPVGSLDSTAA